MKLGRLELAALALAAWWLFLREPANKELKLLEVRDAAGNLVYSMPAATAGPAPVATATTPRTWRTPPSNT